MTSFISCDECNENMRRECFLTHKKKEHPESFFKELFTFQDNQECTVKYPARVRDAIHILSGDIVPYDCGDDNYLDFGGGGVAKDKTTISKIKEHPLKHRQKYFELIKEGLTADNLLSLLQVIIKKPSIIYKDEAEITKQRKINDHLQNQLKETEQHYNDEIRKLNMTDDKLTIETLQINLIKKSNELEKLQYKIGELSRELKHYQEEDEYRMEQNQSKFINDVKEESYVDQMRRIYDKETAKLKKDLEKAKESQKEMEKLKKKNKHLKTHIKLLKKGDDSDSSDSE